MSDEAKGARKVALDLMSDLESADAAVEQGAVACRVADDIYAARVRHRAQLRWKLTDLIQRCMESLGSDEGKR